MPESTYAMLRRLGAKRPMAPAGRIVLVLGEWKDYSYPVDWEIRKGVEIWHQNGKPSSPLSEDEIRAILREVK